MSEEHEQPAEEYTESEPEEVTEPPAYAEARREEPKPSYAERRIDPIVIADEDKQEDEEEKE
ncbi:MAG: hypothetical protein FK732_01180, partial [Asgard group archaeon]|nr:hypothetical protein [Asgard group archaeon]